jgi:phosphoserine phosphatase
MDRQRALKACRLEPTDRIPHWEYLSHPDFVSELTGIDYYEHPRLATERMLEMLPIDVGGVPGSDDPIPRLPDDSSFVDEQGRMAVRWGAGKSWHWDWGHRFQTIDQVLAYRPLDHLDLRDGDIVENRDYAHSAEEIGAGIQHALNAGRAATGDRALIVGGFYNTIFMWPLLTFGWELFAEFAMLHSDRFQQTLADLAALSEKMFRAWAMTDIEVFTSHDDICHARGPTFSPAWLRENIYPYYERFWAILRERGIKVIFISDGNLDAVADDIFACGADGIVAEPFTDWQELIRKHPEKIIVAGGDNRIIARNNREEIFAMVEQMARIGKPLPGYFMSCVNHLPWDLPIDGLKAYFEASERFGYR